MIPPVLIETREEYQKCLERGHDPLLLSHFPMVITLRVEIQKETFAKTIFGRGDIPKANQRFYAYVWKNKPHYCEECGHELYSYSATFVSHILSRGAFPEMSIDPRNTNILCGSHHNQWEDATRNKTMRIYARNVETIEMLKDEYNQLKIY